MNFVEENGIRWLEDASLNHADASPRHRREDASLVLFLRFSQLSMPVQGSAKRRARKEMELPNKVDRSLCK